MESHEARFIRYKDRSEEVLFKGGIPKQEVLLEETEYYDEHIIELLKHGPIAIVKDQIKHVLEKDNITL